MNAITLEVFRHLFASIAEEMGVTLMRSSFSPNIKERRDYSCALFDAQGDMIAQAAHIPVHLGSTPMSVRAAIDAFPAPGPGDIVVLNDPYAGGTHLPDITMVSPVHDPETGRLLFYVANRAHHADVGGITAGSLPLSRHIDDEGIRIPPTLWSEALEAQILAATRTPGERRGDLLAQRAANLRGAQRLLEQWRKHGEALLDAGASLQSYSERVLRSILGHVPDGVWVFSDVLDGDGHGHDGLEIRLRLEIRGEEAHLDFGGTCAQTLGPVNVPRAVTVSAALYAFRCLAPSETPSNAGAMRPIHVRTEPGSLVDAVHPAPVAAGNVETSQRITDVVFGALAQAMPERVPAASGGSMNNVLIGGHDARTDAPFAYYETMGVGAGAARGHHGASGLQTHMTNTLNTPVEALEHAYPFRITRYALRDGSGGRGRWCGGDGLVREYAFSGPATVTLMTERRVHTPYGLSGGSAGQPGRNVLVHVDGREEVLPGKVTLEVEAGMRVRVETPGGGGWGQGSG